MAAAPPPPPPPSAPPTQGFPYDYLFKVLIIGDASVGKVRPAQKKKGQICKVVAICTEEKAE